MTAFEILTKADQIENDDDRVQYLKKNMNPVVFKLLACLFNPNFEFYVPRDMKYKIRNNSMYDSTLSAEAKRLYLLVKPLKISEKKAKEVLEQTIESLSKEEGEFLLSCLKKTNPFQNIGKVFIRKNFPEVLTIKEFPR